MEKVNLITMQCPTCGASLKVENDEAITCVYCGNTVVPVKESAKPAQEAGLGGAMKVEGMRTPASALAYLEQFFEEYDWESFSYAQSLSVYELDILADALKASSADDKNTWFFCFKAISVPYLHKVESCKTILLQLIEEYKKDNLDAYSQFDAYKRISAMVLASRYGIVAQLEKILAYATKYGALAAEMAELTAEMETIKGISSAYLAQYELLEDIPEVRLFIAEKNRKIAERLAAEGIDAASAYFQAKTLLEEKNYVQALDILLKLRGYSDSVQLIEQANKYFTIASVIKVGDSLYCTRREFDEAPVFSIHPVKDGEIENEPLVQDVRFIISNYADVLYYLDEARRLVRFDLPSRTLTELTDYALDGAAYRYDQRLFMLSYVESEYSPNQQRKLIEVSQPTGEVKTLCQDFGKILSFQNNRILCQILEKPEETESDNSYSQEQYVTTTCILDVDTLERTTLPDMGITVHGYVDNLVVYTQEAPNSNNLNLYVRPLGADTADQLVEENIYSFCDIIEGKLFYYVGNASRKTLITRLPDGTQRQPWPLYITKSLFVQGGWLYFIRKSGYNSVLCKSRLDGSKSKIIADDIDSFIQLKNGYLYYIDDVSQLVKVRMDGSNRQSLCSSVDCVLSVKEDKIIFVSSDAYNVQSIYAVSFDGSGIKKLAYDITDAKQYDDATIYYIAATGEQTEDASLKSLYKLDVESHQAESLLNLFMKPKASGGCYVATCVYGSYDCPQVWTLRRFRDNTLGATWYGRLFIRAYYAVSPTVVKLFGHTQWFKNLWLGTLNGMVEKLNAQGVENTPYEDKNW